MKNSYCLIMLLTSIFSQHAWSQFPILPLEETDYPQNAYMKDLNGILSHWEGTWEGTTNDKKLTITFTLFPQHYDDFSKAYRDVLVGKFSVQDLNSGLYIYNNSNVLTYDEYSIQCTPARDQMLWCIFRDVEEKCFNEGRFTLKKSNNEDQIVYSNFRLGDTGYGGFYDCTTYPSQHDIPMPLPTTDLILYRQP